MKENEIFKNDYQYAQENLENFMLLRDKIFFIDNISEDQKDLLGESLLGLLDKLKILGYQDSKFPKNAILESEYSYATLELSHPIAFCATIPNGIISYAAFIIFCQVH